MVLLFSLHGHLFCAVARDKRTGSLPRHRGCEEVLMAQQGSSLLPCQEDPKFPECLRPRVFLLASIAEKVGVFLPGQCSPFSDVNLKSVRLS